MRNVGKDSHRGLRGLFVGEEERGVRCDMNVYKQMEGEKRSNGVKRNENEQSQIYANQTKREKNDRQK